MHRSYETMTQKKQPQLNCAKYILDNVASGDFAQDCESNSYFAFGTSIDTSTHKLTLYITFPVVFLVIPPAIMGTNAIKQDF